MILVDFLFCWLPFGWIFEASLAQLGFLWHILFLCGSFGILLVPSNIKHFLIKIVFVWFWNFQKTPNRLRNFAVGIWRHAYAHGISSDWKYHVAFHDRHTRILWNTGRSCFFMIRCLILLSTQQLTDICLCVCSTPQFIIFSMATV